MDNPFTPSPDSGNGNPATASPAETTADIAQSGSELVAKHRKERSDKGKSRAARSGKAQQQVETEIATPVAQLNLELVKKSVASLVSTVDAVVTRSVYTRCKKLSVETEQSGVLVQAAAVSKSEQEIVSESVSVIFARSAFLVQHAPEVMLGMFLITYTARIVTVMKTLDSIEAKLKKAKRVPESPLKNEPETSE